ncbi:response regulator [Polaribacter sp. MSW13]|uniref:Response regulator n=1 Tax=Polaribacter marinus TaxID=2916838 RepID=A0A9X1VKF1_9FLAO|nr:response regulator [Polaribacter marinus]MCI2227630.1 response regulator [Polaribacter marinus]
MKEKLNCILLIDDDEATNYIHEFIIKKANCAKKVVCKQSGQLALDYLLLKENGKYPQPDIIFLDINMPGMNGWEFLDHYNKLEKNQQAEMILVMLTTSIDPVDKEKAKKLGIVSGFKPKPLTVEMLNNILKEHFPNKF